MLEELEEILRKYNFRKQNIRRRVAHLIQKDAAYYRKWQIDRENEQFSSIGMAALVFHPSEDGRMLFVKEYRRIQGKSVLIWTVPGGGAIKSDHTIENALTREIFEETGIKANPRHLYFVDQHIGITPWKKIIFNFYFFTFDAEAINEEINIMNNKIIAVEWRKKLPENLWFREDYETILEK